MFGPGTKTFSEPTIERSGKSDFFAIAELGRQVLAQYLAQNDFYLVARNLELHWKAPGELHNAFGEKWRARLETNGHRCAIDLRENAVRKRRHKVRRHHFVHKIEM